MAEQFIVKVTTQSSNAEIVKASLRVATNSIGSEMGLDTLVGTYADVGINHGRKVYRKIEAIKGHEHIKVVLYYWDTRDGRDFSGWWFGDDLGSSCIYARCSTVGLPLCSTPPRAGWKIPWDAERSLPGLLTVEMTDPERKSPHDAERSLMTTSIGSMMRMLMNSDVTRDRDVIRDPDVVNCQVDFTGVTDAEAPSVADVHAFMLSEDCP